MRPGRWAAWPPTWMAWRHPAAAGAVGRAACAVRSGAGARRGDCCRGAGRVSVGQPGHRHRCLAHREFRATRPGRRDGGLCLGLSVALLVSGAGVIKAADSVGWHGALLGVAALLALSPLVTLLAPEPPVAFRRVAASFTARLTHAVVDPLREILSRPGALTILGFVALFKLGEAMAGVMTAPFYTWLGFDRASIAVANGPFSLAATFAGTAVGAWLVARLGVGRALLCTGWMQTAAMGMYLLLARSAGEHHILFATVVTEAFAEGMADAAFITFLSGLCSPAFAATQYALLSSLAAIALRTVGGFSGFLAQATGWTLFYGLTMFAALPAMLLMLRLLRRYPPPERLPA